MSGETLTGTQEPAPGTPAGASSADTLLAQAARGDREAFSLFVTETQRAVYRLALTITANGADAEDILQETYMQAWRAAAQFRGESSAITWLLLIARREAWRLARRRAPTVGAEQPTLEALGLAAGWGSDDPERIASRAQNRELFHRALASLPEDYREILTLRDLEGISGIEVAQALGVELSAMKSRLHRARLALAAVLREEGFHEQ